MASAGQGWPCDASQRESSVSGSEQGRLSLGWRLARPLPVTPVFGRPVEGEDSSCFMNPTWYGSRCPCPRGVPREPAADGRPWIDAPERPRGQPDPLDRPINGPVPYDKRARGPWWSGRSTCAAPFVASGVRPRVRHPPGSCEVIEVISVCQRQRSGGPFAGARWGPVATVPRAWSSIRDQLLQPETSSFGLEARMPPGGR